MQILSIQAGLLIVSPWTRRTPTLCYQTSLGYLLLPHSPFKFTPTINAHLRLSFFVKLPKLLGLAIHCLSLPWLNSHHSFAKLVPLHQALDLVIYWTFNFLKHPSTRLHLMKTGYIPHTFSSSISTD